MSVNPTLRSPAAESGGGTGRSPDSGSVAAIDASSRWPLLVLFGHALFWLVLSTVISLVVAIKFHKGDFLADSAWLTLGRLRPAATHTFLYGFASQASIGVALWLLCRLGGVRFLYIWPAVVAGKLWNFAVLVGFVAILMGKSTGFEWLEMPRYAAGLLFVAYLILGLTAAGTFASRRSRELYPSQWFILAGLFCFPWIFSASTSLLLLDPVRGTLQAAVSAWHTGGSYT